MNKKIVITRPKEQAEQFVQKLCKDVPALNFCDFIFEPVLSIHTLDVSLPNFDQYDGVIVTSRHALNLIGDKGGAKLFCVGDKCRAHGLCAQSAHDLLTVIKDHFDGRPAKLLYLRGQDISLDLKAALAPDHIKVEEKIVYEARAAETLSEDFVNQLQLGQIGAITFFSRRSAEIFISRIEDVHMTNALEGIKALCISPAVLKCVQSFFKEKTYTSSMPNAEGMVSLIQEIYTKKQC